MNTKSLSAVIIGIAGMSLYQASNWWERAYATYRSSELSPDGCVRVDTYSPFWVMPSVLHRMPNPDPTTRTNLGRQWVEPTFKRAYEAGTGLFLGETVVFDPSLADRFMWWGDTDMPGRRIVEANGFPLFDSPRCSDGVTLAKLEAFYEKTRGTGL